MGPDDSKAPKKNLVVFGPLSTPHTESWIRLIDESAYKVFRVTVHPNDLVSVEGRGLFRGKGRFISAPFILILELIRRRTTLLCAHYFSSYGFISLLCGLRPVLFCWGSDVNVFSKKLPLTFRFACWLADKRARAVVAPSDAVAKILEVNGISGAKITTLQYGLEVAKLDEFFESAQPPRDRLRIASIRNGDSLYQIQKIIDAFILMESNVDCELVIFGSGHPNYAIPESMAESKKLRVIGFLSNSNFYDELAACDLFVSIPTRDGLSLAVLEGLGLGLEAILSNVGSYSDLFSELGLSLVNPSISAGDLSEAMMKSVNHSWSLSASHRSARRTQLHEFVKERYDSKEAAKVLQCLLRA